MAIRLSGFSGCAAVLLVLFGPTLTCPRHTRLGLADDRRREAALCERLMLTVVALVISVVAITLTIAFAVNYGAG
jgi:hypothetical protein